MQNKCKDKYFNMYVKVEKKNNQFKLLKKN